MSSGPEVSERKIRPIYEALDSNNYKSALQQCNKLLKKQPDALVLKGLKALILERTGKPEEALKLCDEVKEGKPIDEQILQALTMVYKSLGKFEEIVKIYENATGLNPTNEELGNHLFMAMVRINDFKGQQQVALKLHKTFKSNKYLFWAIMSLLLQAENAPSGQSGILLSLAERMMQKAVQEGRLKHTEEVHLYLIVLLTQNKFEEALEVVTGNLGKMCKGDTEIIRIWNELLIKTEKWTQANELSRNSLTETNLDDWRSYLTYLDSCLHLLSKSSSDENDVSLEDARKFLYSLQETVKKNSEYKRGPFLAEMELEKRVTTELNGKPAKEIDLLVVDYFKIFGAKACCFEDLQPYLKAIPNDLAKKIIKEIKATIDDSSDDEKSKISNIQRNVNVYKLERFLGLLAELTEDDVLSYVNKLWALYKDTLQYGVNITETENQHGDECVILASHALFDLYTKVGKNTFIMQAILLLEMALTKSKHNFQLKLLLIRLYQIVGIFYRQADLYKSMDFKHVQQDTMSHYIVARSFSSGSFEEAIQACYDTQSIYNNNQSETPEMVVQAYKFATFSKIQEFIAFYKELENSIQRALVDREIIRLEFLTASKVTANGIIYIEELDVADLVYDGPLLSICRSDDFYEARRDNRDFLVMLDCNPFGKSTFEEASRVSPKLDKYWLKLFTIIPLILKSMRVDQNVDTIKKLVGVLEKLVNDEIKDIKSVTLEERNVAHTVVKLSHLYLIIKEILSGQKESAEKITSSVDALLGALKAVQPPDTSQLTAKELSWVHFHRFSLFLEACNYVKIVNQIIHDMIGPKNKKSSHRELTKITQSLSIAIKDHIQHLNKQLINLQSKVEGENTALYIFDYIKAGKHIEFCSAEENISDILLFLNKMENSWTASLKALIKETEARIVESSH
ncbi:8272_t:CDS:10 [Acaulospora morrowiae]|uniref:8272_t:CDS:1 n=1 Tax=Acaulospora morrowiae TaxID=94023 RepID=A0A9N8ZN93_9GLOM|nr:8272_t:CDS:10 [Acaulospora morrowiae]